MADNTVLHEAVEQQLRELGALGNEKPEEKKTPEADVNKTISELQGQVQMLTQMLQDKPQERRVGAEGDRPLDDKNQNTQEYKPWDYDSNKFAEEAAKDPGQAVLDSINSKLGLPKGSNPFSLIGLIGNRIGELDKKQAATVSRLEELYFKTEAETFLDTHDEYQATPENFKILEQYRQTYNLPPTSQGLDLAFSRAIRDGYFQPKSRERQHEIEEPNFTRDFAPPRVQLPSVRNAPTIGDEDIASLEAKLDRMPLAEAKKYWERLANGR